MKFAFVFPGRARSRSACSTPSPIWPSCARRSGSLRRARPGLGKLIAEGPAEELNLTTNTQPVMLTAAYACYRAWQAGGPAPSIVAGHSLGEYTALVAAGALAFKDAVPLVRFRAQAMQEPCRWARAAWPRSSASTTTRCARCAPKRRKRAWSKP
jgi:[acyl-carrier-protein] S-malonyltransferase